MSRYPTATDDFLNSLPEDEHDAFLRWAYRRRSREIKARLREIKAEYEERGTVLPEIPTERAIDNWYAQVFPPGTELARAASILAQYENIENPIPYAERSLVLLTLISDTLYKQWENDPTNSGLNYNLHNQLKEIRTAAFALHEAKRLRDRRTEYLDAAYRFAELLEGKAEKANVEIKGLILAVLAEIEAEQEISG